MTRAQWLAERKLGIGGSDIAAVLGINKYSTPLDIWRDKQPDAVEKAVTQDMLRGQMLEEFVAKMWQELSGNKVRKSKFMIYTHPDFPIAKASPDRFYGAGKDFSVLECKTIARKVLHEELPNHWICQLQWTMFCTGAKKGTIAWCSPPGFSIEWLEIEADEELQEVMITEAQKFWDNYVVTGIAPPPLTGEDVVSLHPRESEKVIEASEDILKLAIEYKKLGESKSIVEEAQKEISDQIKSFMNDAGVLKYGDNVVATYKARKGKTEVDAEALKASYPDLYKSLLVTKPGSRTLLVKEQ